ncbi:MAG TPA: HIT domain-containing protein [Rhizomicrobium sp.]|nr:HIT domain-containing protein [Rhizomicrobium sp.]
MESFVLHQRLAADTRAVADWGLSRVLLMNDARYPWLILVPRRAGLVELHDLKHAERLVLMEEIARAGAALKSLTGCAKINTGALGNLVPQLHVHVVARGPGDAAWPGPVWGQGTAEPYAAAALATRLGELRAALGGRS